jgi:hypothetical protein
VLAYSRVIARKYHNIGMSPYLKNLTLLSVRIRVLLIGGQGLSVYIVSWTRTFEVVMPMSHKHQPARAAWIFYRVVPSLVLNTVCIMRRVHRAFETFDDPDWDLAQFIGSRVFHRCDRFLVSWLHDIEPYA